MDTMQVFAVILMIIGFVLGFGLATRAALKVLADKNASINALEVLADREEKVAENYREVLNRYFKNFPTVMERLQAELNRRDNLDMTDYDSWDITDESYSRFVFDNDFCLVQPTIKVDMNKQVNNQWPSYFDSLDDIETPEPYWEDFKIPSESSIKVSKAHYDRLDKRTENGGAKTKNSSVHGREFGRRKEFKCRRTNSKAFKRQEKDAWIAFNEKYEEELPYELEEVILKNKADSLKKALNDLSLEEALLAK